MCHADRYAPRPSEMFDYFGGIDFSGAREPLSNLWTALGDEREGQLRIVDLRPHAFRADLAAFVGGGWRVAAAGGGGGGALWGADFPFGLPRSALEDLEADGIRDWPRLLAWAADLPPDEVKTRLAAHTRVLRSTDAGGALAPLDLRLYKQTVEGFRWLHELREEAEVSVLPQAPAEGVGITLIEVYPSAACKELGLPRRRVPGRPGETRARAAALRTFLTFDDPALEAIAVTLEDAWDATIACLAAWLCRDDLDQPARVAAADAAAREGWIYRPPLSVAGR
jgi:hypothetical protein